jgi:hypothetical protein
MPSFALILGHSTLSRQARQVGKIQAPRQHSAFVIQALTKNLFHGDAYRFTLRNLQFKQLI